MASALQPTALAVQATCSSRTAWDAITPAAAIPSPRAFASLTPSPDNSLAYLFGGQLASGAVVNDLFVVSSYAGFSDAQAGTAELTNLAAASAAVAFQSTIFNGSMPYLALQPSSTYTSALGEPLCSQTESATAPWWAVDLGSAQSIASITVWQALSGVPAGSLAGFRVFVGSTNSSWQDPSNFACPQPFADFFGASVTVPCQTTGRFVWVTFAQTAVPQTRSLILCGVQVWQRTPWAWRALTQQVQVATNKRVRTSNNWYNSPGTQYQPSNVVDGSFGSSVQVAPYTCYHSTLSTAAVTSTLTIDLGRVYDVSYVQLWPRTDCCTNPRNLYWQMYIGNSLNPQFNTQCNMPTDVTPSPKAPGNGVGPTYAKYNTTVPCAARGRYVIIMRPYRAADGTTNNYWGLCEVMVFSNQQVALPIARAGHAATTFKGQMVIAGGFDKNGNALGDVNMFDLTSLVWTAIGAVTGTAPAARYYASMLPATANALAYFGGTSGAPYSDLNLLTFPSCPAYVANGTSLACYAGGSSCVVTCAFGYSLTDSALLTCGPAGLYYSATPPCTGLLLQAPPTGAGTAPVISAVDSQSIAVTWSPITNANPGFAFSQYIRYLVQTTPRLYSLSGFAAGVSPSDWANWQFFDNTNIQFHSFQSRQLLVSSVAGGDCRGGPSGTLPTTTQMRCYTAHRAIPTTISSSSTFFVEGYAYLDNSINPTQTGTSAGIAICELVLRG